MVQQDDEESRSLALTPTWSVATVLTVFVAVSLLVERSIHRLCNVSFFPHFFVAACSAIIQSSLENYIYFIVLDNIHVSW